MNLLWLLLIIIGIPPPKVSTPAGSIVFLAADAADVDDQDGSIPERRIEKAYDRAPSFRTSLMPGLCIAPAISINGGHIHG